MFVTICKKIADFLNGTGPAPPIAKVYNPPIPQPGRFPAPPRKRHLPPLPEPTPPPVAVDPTLKEQRCVSRQTIRREQRTFMVSQRILENIRRRRINHWHRQPPTKPSVTDAPQLEVPVPFEILHKQALTLRKLGDNGDDLEIFLRQLQILGNQREMTNQLNLARFELEVIGRRVKEKAEVKAREKAEMDKIERNIQEMRRKRKRVEKQLLKDEARIARQRNQVKRDSFHCKLGGGRPATGPNVFTGIPVAQRGKWAEDRAAIEQEIARQHAKWAARDAARAEAAAAQQREEHARAEAERVRVERAMETARLHVQQEIALRQAEENRRAEERRLAQEARNRFAEAARQEEERRQAEATRREAERLRVEAIRLEEERIRALHAARQRSEEARRQAEIFRAEEEQRQRLEEARRAHERRQAEEAARTQAEQAAESAQQALVQHQFTEYGLKWDLLRGRTDIGLICFFQVPWPVLGVIHSVDWITQVAMNQFIFHEAREGYEGKPRKEILKMEILRWHPDKFNNTVIPRMIPTDIEATREGADRVVKILTRMMES